jgi:hypothetical protein
MEITVLPDGSGFCTSSLPLPKDHWLFDEKENAPPMPYILGISEERQMHEYNVREAAKYAIRASTMNGKEMDFDPDVMVQNLIIGLMGYRTKDGLSST